MKKFVKGVSVLAALAMVNPATIVSATTATGQPQSDVTQNTNETATKATPLPTNNVHHISNMFVTAAQYVAFGGMGTLDLHLYSSEETQYLESIYIVIPKGLTVDGGIDAMQKSLDRYIQTKPINPATGPIIHNGTLSIRQLKDTVTTGREVYQIVPSTGAYVVKREYPENSLMTIPIRVAGKDSNLTQILLNAETKDDMEQDILFMGAGDGQNVEYDGSISYYPLIATQKVGITEADDEYVCGIAAYGYEKIVKLFTPQVDDQYDVIDPYTREVVRASVVTTGDSGSTYSRVGLVDTLTSLGLNPAIYDEKSLTINRGNLNDTAVILTPLNGFTNDPSAKLKGQTYTITVKRFAKDVAVKYVDQDGKAITDANGDTTETLTGDVGDDYHAVHKDIAGYTATVGEDNQTGKFADTPQMITYHYTKIPVPAKNITVNYEDTDGKQIAASETLTGNVDDPYATVKKEIMGYAFKKVANDNATGTFSETAQTVTYVYAKIGKDVTVNYVDAAGKELATSKTLSGNVGDKVNSEEAKVAGYAMVKTNATADDVFTDDAQIITYHYAKIGKDVTVNYVDAAGKKLAESKTLGGNVGDKVNSEALKVAGYAMVKTNATANDVFTDDVQTITYHYAKIGKDVTVNYVDAAGKELATSKTLSGNVGDKVNAEEAKVAGYAMVKTNATADDVFTDDAQTITYHYAKIGKDVTVNYVDESGNKIVESKTFTGNIGDPYTAVKKEVSGYDFKKVTGNETGTLSETAQTVTYIYAKIGKDVTVNYVDADGKKLAESKTLSGNVGDKVNAEEAKVAGYAMVKTNATADDVFTDDVQTITYHYAKIGKDVTVNYVDAAGKKLAESKTLSGNIGDKVNAEEAKVAGYAMVKTNATADDVFTDDVQTITYHYAKIGKDVTVNYVDAAGKELATSKTLSGNVGDKVNSEATKIAGYAMVKTNATADDVFTDDVQTITYHYAKIGKDVTVNYVDAAGKELATSKTLSGNVGDKVNSEALKVAGYAMVKTNATADDVFTDDVQTITYHYAKIGKDVTVNYVDAAGKKLATSKTLSGNVGDKVNSEATKIAGYAMVKTNATADDVFTDDVQTITYHYAKIGKDVTVNYVDAAGKELATSKTLSGNVGDKVNSEAVKVAGYAMVKTNATANDVFTDDAQTITYQYAKIGKDVTVNYVDADGKKLAESKTLSGNVGDKVNAEEAKVEGYAMVKTNATADDVFTDDVQTITYHYVKKADNVTVKYVDESGNEIAPAKALTGNVGAAYQAVQASIDGYTYKQVTDNAKGTFTDKPQTVTYVYTKNPVAGANVTVNYQDESGNQLAKPAILTGNVGAAYQAVQASITGYTYKQVIGQPTGTFSNAAQTVTYVYTKNPVAGANVTVNYQDEAGKQLAASAILTGNIDTSYHAVQATITGYHYKAVTGAPDGRFTANAQTVTYVYTKDADKPVKIANQTVKYVDENGQTIAGTEILTGNIGTPYHAIQKAVAGYSYKSVTGAPTGNFTTDAPTVTYIYTKDPVQGANVTVNYQDEAGKQIANPATLSGNVGSGYQAVQTPIDGYTFKQVIGTPTGTFSNAAQTVTYVYTKNPVQAGNVTVNYQDEAGNQLAKSATLTGNVGDNYQAVQLAVDGYTFQKVIGNPNGTLTDAAQSVTYVYAKTVTKPEASTTPIEQPKQPVKQPKTTTDQTPSEKVAPAAKTTKVTKDRQKLPQTGVKQANGLLAVVGALLIAIVGMAFKKRKN